MIELVLALDRLELFPDWGEIELVLALGLLVFALWLMFSPKFGGIG